MWDRYANTVQSFTPGQNLSQQTSSYQWNYPYNGNCDLLSFTPSVNIWFFGSSISSATAGTTQSMTFKLGVFSGIYTSGTQLALQTITDSTNVTGSDLQYILTTPVSMNANSSYTFALSAQQTRTTNHYAGNLNSSLSGIGTVGGAGATGTSPFNTSNGTSPSTGQLRYIFYKLR